MTTALIIGATSSLARECSRQLASAGWSLLLCARNGQELKIIQKDLQIRYNVEVQSFALDLLKFNMQDFNKHTAKIGAAFVFTGDMGSGDFNDSTMIEQVIQVNFTAPAQILTSLAEHMEKRAEGLLVVISSVAGDRGRQSNYPYGAAKAGLNIFTAGLRNRLANKGVSVMTVKLGYVDTPMTYGLHSRLIASREYIAKSIIQAIDNQKNEIYLPFFWRYIMWIIKLIPEHIFKKLKF